MIQTVEIIAHVIIPIFILFILSTYLFKASWVLPRLIGFLAYFMRLNKVTT